MSEINYELEVYKLRKSVRTLTYYIVVLFVLLCASFVVCMSYVDSSTHRAFQAIGDIRYRLKLY
jgi:hypothetical protein